MTGASSSAAAGTPNTLNLHPQIKFLESQAEKLRESRAALNNNAGRSPQATSELYEKLHDTHRLMALSIQSLRGFTKVQQLQHLQARFGSIKGHLGYTFYYAALLSKHVALAAQGLLQETDQSDTFVAISPQNWIERNELETLAAKGLGADKEIARNTTKIKLALMLENDMKRLSIQPDTQMVHAPGFLEDCVFRLREIENALRAQIQSIDQTRYGIEHQIAQHESLSIQEKAGITEGLNVVCARRELIEEGPLRISVSHSLCVVWTYILNHGNPVTRRNLIDSLFKCLSDIGADPTCDVGRVQRIVHIPDGIDHAFMINSIPSHIIRDDIQTRTARLHQWLDALLDHPDKSPFKHANASHSINLHELLGKKVSWMQTQVQNSIKFAYTSLGIQPAIYASQLAKALDDIETNVLLINDLCPKTVGFHYRNYLGQTGLMRLIRDDDTDGVKAHLDSLSREESHTREKYLNAICTQGQAAVSYAMTRPRLDTLALLLECPYLRMDELDIHPDIHPLFNACFYGKPELLRAIVSSPAMQMHFEFNNLNRTNVYGLTAFHIAVHQGHHACVEILLDQPHCNINIPNRAGHTPLITAAIKLDVQIIEYLLKHPVRKMDIQVNHVDANGDTALTTLIEHPATVGRPDSLAEAQYRQNQLDAIALLLSHHALDIERLDQNGDCALRLADFYDDKDLVELIRAELETRAQVNARAQPERASSATPTATDSEAKRRRFA